MPMDKQPLQLPLTISTSLSSRRDSPTPIAQRPLRERISGIDQMLDTHDVEKITGRHRCTIYRWVLAGTFPEKRAGGGRGWLR